MQNTVQILYVDDEENLRTLVQQQLTTEGFAVETADDGDTAIEKLGKKSYEVVLLDIRMPRLNGIEVLKHMKNKGMTTRIIMLTAVDDLTVALEAVKMGAIDYLTKPYDYNELVSAIMRAVGK
jgi:DNA-binding response OmpR family regulator